MNKSFPQYAICTISAPPPKVIATDATSFLDFLDTLDVTIIGEEKIDGTNVGIQHCFD